MLIDFKVSNFRSIGEEQVISLVPAPKQKEHSNNIISIGKYEVLNALALYGANASGKSNLIRAMSMLDRLVNFSGRTSSTSKLPYDPFALRKGWDSKPTEFEITFVVNNARYRYGLQYDAIEIKKEWLFRKLEGREVNLFNRDLDVIDVSNGFHGSKKIIDAAIEATKGNSLFLSVCDMFNLEDATTIMEWFWKFRIIDGLNTDLEEIQTVELFGNEVYREKIKAYLSSLSIDVLDLDVLENELDDQELADHLHGHLKADMSSSFLSAKKYTVLARHRVYGEDEAPNGETRSWNWEDRESSGAKKAFQLSGPILWALANGGVLIIDEIEAQLHPIMTLSIIEIFLDSKTNINNTQLIFSTHDTNLLSYSNLRRDQINFAEKNKWESTELFSLSDFVYLGTKERPDSDKEKRYFEGRYGAIPMLGEFKEMMRQMKWQKEAN